ncbi:MAG: tol-pal system protein YbgF [Alphaproteobacteria bacterium]
MALAGWLVTGAPAVWAQQQGAPQQAAQPVPAPATPQGPLDERILRLEQRILDLQTVIATLQTFVRDGGGVPLQQGFPPGGGEGGSGGVMPGGGPSELSIRVLALETQIKALTTQMEQIATRLDQGNFGAGAPPQQGALHPQGQDQLQRTPGLLPGNEPRMGIPGFSTSTDTPPSQNPFSDPGPAPQAQAAQQAPQVQAGVQPPPQPFPPAVVPPSEVPPAVVPGAGGGARAVYEASYESFVRNDFQRAGIGFQSFVKTFPDDELISNAYYWLGRTHYARRQYEPAAKAFLAGYKKDKKNTIAPEALLHLGMSLEAMGEKGAACSTLGAISKQFPNLPETLKRDVANVLKRTGC